MAGAREVIAFGPRTDSALLNDFDTFIIIETLWEISWLNWGKMKRTQNEILRNWNQGGTRIRIPDQGLARLVSPHPSRKK